MRHEHVEYDDRTEREYGVILGWVDPAEQTGSDAEVEPLSEVPHISVAARWHRWRLFRLCGHWIARQPSHLDRPMFRDGKYGYVHRDWARVLHELQLAVLIAQSYE